MKLKGAEAILIPKDDKILIKRRIAKAYRVSVLDEKIRKLRTRSESKLLQHAYSHNVKIPRVFNVDEGKFEFELEKIPGELLENALEKVSSKNAIKLCELAGREIGKLHLCKVTHGDCTTSNFMVTPTGAVYLIDFGLSEMTASSEERALDLQLFKKAVLPKYFNAFLDGYEKEMKQESKPVLERLENIEKRGRYKKRN